MKATLFAFATLLLLQGAFAADVAIPKTCEDVLSPETCTKLRTIAQTFHEKVGIVNEAVRAALEKHINGATETIKFVKEYLVGKATNFKCEDVLSEERCKQLVDLAARFKVSAAELRKDIEEAVVDGMTQAKAIYTKTVEILLNKVNNLSCEQLMDIATCAKIKEFGTKVHATSHEIKEAVIEAFSKGATSAVDFYNKAIEYLKEEVSCDKILPMSACEKIRKVAQSFGVSLQKVIAKLREVFANGATKASDLYKAALKYIMENWIGKIGKRELVKRGLTEEDLALLFDDEVATAQTCEDVFSADTCAKLRAIAKTFHEKASIVNDAVRAAVQKHIKGATETLAFVKQYLVQKAGNFTCTDVLPAEMCKQLTDLAGRFKVSAADLKKDIEEAVAEGITQAKQLYAKAVEVMLINVKNLSCEKLIDAATCTKIKEFGAKIHATHQEIKRAVIEAFSEHANSTVDFFNKAITYLKEEVSCDSILSAETCEKIRKYAQLFGVNVQKVTMRLREVFANGVSKVSDLYKAAIKYITESWIGGIGKRQLIAKREITSEDLASLTLDDLDSKTCEDVLSADTCSKLRAIAQTFHEKVGIVNEAVRAALEKHINGATEVLLFVKQYLVEKATNFKCEDVFSAEQCKKLVDLAARFKVSAAELKKDIEEAVVEGLAQAKDVYAKAVEVMLLNVKNLSCEKLIDANTCTKITEFGNKVHATSQELKRAIVEAFSQGASSATDFYNKAITYLKEEVSCDSILSTDTCEKIRSLARNFGLSMEKITLKLRELYSNGVTKVTDLYKAAVKYIMDNWWGGIGKRQLTFESRNY